MSRTAKQVWAWAAAAIVVRLLFIFTARIDSDEPQHLHVAWGWSRGFIQYLDLFDNHFPLLHLLFAPLMELVPESSAVFLLMRLAIAPVAIGCGWLLFMIARPLIGIHRAVVTAAIFSVMPPWLPKSVEFRNDMLWLFFWLAALTLLVARRRPAFVLAGLAAGLCFLASVKAVPLLLAHLLALVAQRRLIPLSAPLPMTAPHPAFGHLLPASGEKGNKEGASRERSGVRVRGFHLHITGARTGDLLRMIGGASIPLAALALFMHAHGAFDEMVYATLLFNASLPVDAARRIGGAMAFAVIAPAMVLRGGNAVRGSQPLEQHLALFAFCYVLVLLCFWPSITSRDFLPLVPLASLALATTRIARVAPAALFVAVTIASVLYARLWKPVDRSRHRLVDAVVQVSAPGEFVFDLKGDSIFRRRPVRYIYEDVGRALTENGTLADLGPEQIVANRCCVAVADSPHIPPRTREFLNEHFIDRGPLRVCASRVDGDSFTIAVPQVYAVIARDPSRVVIDNAPYRGPRYLAAGTHTISKPPHERVTVIWWRAARVRAAQP